MILAQNAKAFMYYLTLNVFMGVLLKSKLIEQNIIYCSYKYNFFYNF